MPIPRLMIHRVETCIDFTRTFCLQLNKQLQTHQHTLHVQVQLQLLVRTGKAYWAKLSTIISITYILWVLSFGLFSLIKWHLHSQTTFTWLLTKGWGPQFRTLRQSLIFSFEKVAVDLG